MSCWEGLVLRFVLLAYTAMITAPANIALMATDLADTHGMLSVGMPVAFKADDPVDWSDLLEGQTKPKVCYVTPCDKA